METHWLYDVFEAENPFMSKRVVQVIPEGTWNFIVELDNGERWRYDGTFHTTRLIPKDSRVLSEDEFRLEFRLRLRSLLWCKGVSQKELAESTGMSQSQISAYLNGKTTPSFYAIDKIAKALDCSVDELRYL